VLYKHQQRLTKMRLPLYLHIAVWSVLLGIFLFQSAPIVGHAVSENKIGPVEANQTIDTYLRALNGVSAGSQQLNDVLESLPRHRLLVIFVRADNPPSDFLGMLVAYLSWPREVRIVKIQNATAAQEVATIDPSSVAGMVFCSLSPPPSLGKGARFGSSILLVPAPEVKQ
jgi:hypothetical protein